MEDIKSFTKKDGTDFLSNMYPSTIKFDGLTYQTAEACFQAQKYSDEEKVLFTNLKPKNKDRWKSLGEVAKHLGGKHGIRFLSESELREWDKKKLAVMEEVVRQKFLQNIDLKKKLIATGDANIFEGRSGNRADTFWGVRLNKQEIIEGKNHLGIILMKIRNELLR